MSNGPYIPSQSLALLKIPSLGFSTNPAMNGFPWIKNEL
jgi:hypothetical protein